MEEHLYIITYDISDHKRWRKVFNIMHGYGDWLQLSVFQCRLSRKKHAELVMYLDNMIHHNDDHVLIMDMGSVDKVLPKVVSLGNRAFSSLERAPKIL